MDDKLAQTDEVWPTIINESQALADEYEANGWEVITITPGDVVPVPQPGDSEYSHIGLDVLVGGDMYDEVEAAVGEFNFNTAEVFRQTQNGLVYLTLIVKAVDAKQAISLPLYYRIAEAERLFSLINEGKSMGTRIRPLSGEGVTFDHDDPELLLPDGSIYD